jgi:CheY-like chemotaxis protein
VLLAQDQAVLRSRVAVVLRRSGYEGLEAEDGEHSMEIAAGRDYLVDVLVTDLIMPRLGGQPRARRLRQECPDLAVSSCPGRPRKRSSAAGFWRRVRYSWRSPSRRACS